MIRVVEFVVSCTINTTGCSRMRRRVAYQCGCRIYSGVTDSLLTGPSRPGIPRSLPLDAHGHPERRPVWEILQRPCGPGLCPRDLGYGERVTAPRPRNSCRCKYVTRGRRTCENVRDDLAAARGVRASSPRSAHRPDMRPGSHHPAATDWRLALRGILITIHRTCPNVNRRNP